MDIMLGGRSDKFMVVAEMFYEGRVQEGVGGGVRMGLMWWIGCSSRGYRLGR